MIVEIPGELVHVLILDKTGVYSQIHNEGYFFPIEVEQIKQQYSNNLKWKIVIL